MNVTQSIYIRAKESDPMPTKGLIWSDVGFVEVTYVPFYEVGTNAILGHEGRAQPVTAQQMLHVLASAINAGYHLAANDPAFVPVTPITYGYGPRPRAAGGAKG